MKSLYGLKQAPRLFYIDFTTYIKEFGFESTHSDGGLFQKDGPNGCIIATLHVDDLVITGSDTSGIAEFICFLKQKY